MIEPAPTVEIEDFFKLDIRVGRIVAAEANAEARVPAYVLEIDFGPLGMKRSSAQVTANYSPTDLVGRLVVALTNVPVKKVAGVRSECLVLAALSAGRGTVLLEPGEEVEPGSRIA